MKKDLRSPFTPRQYMLARDFEVFYYSDLHFQTVQPHAHGYYEFYFFQEGHVEMEIQGQRLPLRPGDLVLIPPGALHRAVVTDDGTPYRRFVLWISREFYAHLQEQSDDYTYLFRRAEEHREYRHRFDVLTLNDLRGRLFSLLDEIHAHRFGREPMISLSVSALILTLNRVAYAARHPTGDRNSRSTYEGIMDFIHTHLEEDLSLDRLARELYVSKFTIAHLFQRSTGLSVHQYIVKKRLHACADAIRGGESITGACRRFGFREYSGFYRAFRKEFGQSPAQFRDAYLLPSSPSAQGDGH